MKKIKDLIRKPFFPAILLVLSVVGTILFYAARCTWIFVDIKVNIEKFTFILLWIMILNSVATGILLFCRVRKVNLKNKELYLNKAYCVAVILFSAITFVLFCAGAIFAFSMLRDELAEVYLLYFTKSLYNALFFILVPFFALFFTALGKKARKSVVAFSLAVVSVMVISKFLPLAPFKITSDPSVLDTGKNYSVVFSTNDYGTGFVEYTYGGKEYKIFDQNGGRLKSDSKIHSINIPYDT